MGPSGGGFACHPVKHLVTLPYCKILRQGAKPIIIFRYILSELVPQFISSLIIICAIIIISQLVRLSKMIVSFGVTIENIVLPFLYILLPFLSLTIPMAFLAGVILTFSRLSADGEFTAMQASGYSLRKAAIPVLLIASMAYGVSSTCGLYLEAWGRRELVAFLYRKTQTQLDNLLKFKMQAGVFVDDFLGYVLYAEKISPDRSEFENVLLAPGSGMREQNFTLLAPTGSISGSVKEGDLRFTLNYGVAFGARQDANKSSVLKFRRAELDLLRIFQNQIVGDGEADQDYRSYTPAQLAAYIDELKEMPERDKKTQRNYLKARYMFHSRYASSFAVIPFALFGMVLGITDQRRGKNQAFVGGILTIIAGYLLLMGCQWLAVNNIVIAPIAVWIPNVLLTATGAFFIYQKGRLPPSEPILKWSNMPFVRGPSVPEPPATQ